ncbi:LRR receptor-like serine/threonine-protein kinase FLS2 [Vigna unguiculata]|uniref:LRR receptor-like serine/threonine-protein kinase FLS2 n=1 Tax=Vigna unguiculata TaxID=3917 RepID=A0A4D6MAD9_VIGUN|nr:LRR receptor-like serine/threonine-protein kinase FLS2 [Vigna unguiculata]
MTFIISQFSVLLLSLFGAFTFQKIVCNNLSQVRCNEKDRETLEMFKEGVIDPSNNLLTWSTQQDCCQWKGVHCDNTTSRVTKLDLSQQFLQGEIKLSLLELQFLYHLDLSCNKFNVISIPPTQNNVIFGSNLHYLDLYALDISLEDHISMDNLDWLSQLSSLRYLNLGFINLHNANWLQLLVMLPSLADLRLCFCELNITSSLKHVNFTSLVTLDLSGNYFTSKSLRCLFNLSTAISHLDLGEISLSGYFDVQWLSQLHSVKYLDLSYIDLHEETNWLLAMPPSLSVLHLSKCQLTNISPTLKHVNLTSLVTLDLSYNHFNSELPHWLFNLSRDVSYLKLKDNSFYGEIPSSLFNYQNLEYLDLSGNMFSGSIPFTLGNLTYLVVLCIGYNSFSGIISEMHFSRLHNLEELDLSKTRFHFSPEWIPLFQLKRLYLDDTNQGNYFTSKSLRCLFNLSTAISHLDLGEISLSGYFDVQWLSQLHSVKYLDLSYIDLHEETNWLLAMPPSLSVLHLSKCQLTNISPTLKHVNLTSLVTLDLSYNHFNSELPHWLFNLSRDVSYLKLKDNSFYGEIPSSLFNYQNLEYLDLSGNMFSGSIPFTLGNLTYLVVLCIGYNSFSGIISEMHFSRLHNLEELDLSKTRFHFSPEWIPLFQLKRLYLDDTNQGPQFPPWIYTQKSLSHLCMSSSKISYVEEEKFRGLIASIDDRIDLSNNSIRGMLPHLSPKVKYVDFSQNSFTGSIPHAWKNLKHLVLISLWNNDLFGEALMILSCLTRLAVINLEKNDFFGAIPNNMSRKLEVVILRSNKFEGSIPPQLFLLSNLIHLDLAHNKLSGSIPQITYNTKEMIVDHYYAPLLVDDSNIDFYEKGQVYECKLDFNRRTIDLSANKISGEIPTELFRLIRVQTLNLSYNHLTGTIPKTIGGMKNLESLDLSNNKLFGEIPENMANLSFLSYLNLSCNNFSGQIPIGTQLQSFGVSSYNGNPELCGAPLTKCSMEKNVVNTIQHRINKDGEFDEESVYLGMGVGFAVGFCGVFASLVIFRKWRQLLSIAQSNV